MAYDGLPQLVPQKRSLSQDERSTYLEFKTKCFSACSTNVSNTGSLFHYQSEAIHEDGSEIFEARWSSTTDTGLIASTHEAEVIGTDKSGAESQDCPDLHSPGPVEVCYGCVCRTISV